MEYKDRHKEVLMQISSLPKKMLSVGGMDNVTEFVLHDLCSKDCFNLQKAAYLVDNPHFDCVKGIAGYARNEAYSRGNHWQNPQDFTDHMSKNVFNNKVRAYEKSCVDAQNAGDQKIKDIACSLGIDNPGYHVFKLKHDNHGIFLFEQPQEADVVKYIPEAVSLFSFCPIF